MSRHRKPLTPQELDELQERTGPAADLDFYERREVQKSRHKLR
ncbi:hypothetical protein SAMN05216193_101278 [Pseudomonas jinjuensis]|uniref:Uncharacterized protein n=2 Tax=Pseudomonas jinjuensis TaxID=198616 RepID=A0A1G9Z026_9PSED|nr:hypothetical protein SAMN05216193_101278 [Pseudomonas jinjuensis]